MKKCAKYPFPPPPPPPPRPRTMLNILIEKSLSKLIWYFCIWILLTLIEIRKFAQQFCPRLLLMKTIKPLVHSFQVKREIKPLFCLPWKLRVDCREIRLARLLPRLLQHSPVWYISSLFFVSCSLRSVVTTLAAGWWFRLHFQPHKRWRCLRSFWHS